MKWSKNWVAAMMLLPAMYLASCGSGNDDRNTTDSISTQSAPPTDTATSPGMTPSTTDTMLGDTSANNLRDDANPSGSPATGSTPVTGNTAVENERASASEQSVSTATGESRTGTTARKSNRYKRSGTTVKSSVSKDRTTTTDDQSTSRTDQTSRDTSTTTQIEQSIDSVSRTVDTTNTTSRLRDTTMMSDPMDTARTQVDRMGDTSANRLNRLGDSSTMNIRDTMSMDTTGRTGLDTSGRTWDTTGNRQGEISDTSANRSTENRTDTLSPQQQDTSGNMSTSVTGINFTPTVFIPEQMRGNYAEIKLARLAIEKSQNEEVKQIATTLENDHNILLRELQTMARNSSSLSDSIPTAESEMAKQHINTMGNLSGQEFDRQWLQHMHMMHDQKVQQFEQAENNNSIQDAQLRIWVNKTTPSLRKHRDMLSQALTSLNR